MRSSVGGALLVVTLCVVTTGCASGVYGGAVTAQNPNQAAPATTASSSKGLGGWESALNSELEPTKAPAQFRGKAVIARPTILAGGVGAAVVVVGHPKRGSRWRFTCWIKGSADLAGPVLIQLQSLASNARTWVKLPARRESLGDRWRRYSVSGEVKPKSAIALRAVVWVKTVTLHSRLQLGGVVVKQISAGRS